VVQKAIGTGTCTAPLTETTACSVATDGTDCELATFGMVSHCCYADVTLYSHLDHTHRRVGALQCALRKGHQDPLQAGWLRRCGVGGLQCGCLRRPMRA
jgi:hypothetical protein